MNPDIKAQWTAALRSGEYKQGQGGLRNPQDDTFCCLGVLCDLAVKAEVDVEVEGGVNWVGYDGFSGLLPNSVQEWAGLDTCDPELAWSFGYWDEASTLNDSGVPFTQIADLVDWAL